MLTNIKYECELCGEEYSDPKECQECENRGLTNLEILPKGFMYPYNHNGYVGIFAVSHFNRFRDNKHLMTMSSWAFRANGSNTIGKETCGGSLYDNDCYRLYKERYFMTNEDLQRPEFKLMMEYLISEGIEPTYFDPEKEFVTIKQFEKLN